MIFLIILGVLLFGVLVVFALLWSHKFTKAGMIEAGRLTYHGDDPKLKWTQRMFDTYGEDATMHY